MLVRLQLLLLALCLSAWAGPFTFITVDHPAASPCPPFTSCPLPGTQLSTINNHGVIMGVYGTGVTGTGTAAFRYDNGAITNYQFPGASTTSNAAINDNGLPAGTVIMDPRTYPQGFIGDTLISYPGSLWTFLFDINSSGQAVGFYALPTPDIRQTFAFVYEHGTFNSVAFPGAQATWVTGINDAGQIVGYYLSMSFATRGFVYDGTQYLTIEYPGSRYSRAAGINSTGQVVGSYEMPGESSDHGFIYSRGIYQALDIPGAFSTWPEDINDAGQIVGRYNIIDRGDFTVHGFLADPATIPEPATILTFAAGIALVLAHFRARKP